MQGAHGPSHRPAASHGERMIRWSTSAYGYRVSALAPAKKVAGVRSVSTVLRFVLLTSDDPAAAARAITTASTDELPPGWAVATDPSGRTYFWHRKTQKVQWERPTEDTPIN